MARFFILILMNIFVFAGASISSFAAEKYTVASDCTWPPMEILDDNKQPMGYSIDYIKAVAKECGIEVEPVNVAWDGILSGVMTGKYDIVASSVTVTPERAKQVQFTEPYMEVDQAVILPAGQKIENLTDLNGKKVGGQISTTGIFTLRSNKIKSDIKEYDDIGLAIQDLVAGRLDAVICDFPVAMYYVHKKPDTAGKIDSTFKFPTDERYAFVIQKNRPELLAKLNQCIRQIKENGTEKELRNKWMGE